MKDIGRDIRHPLRGFRRPTDPATLGAVALVLGGGGLAAGDLPARRASRIDPMRARRKK